MSETTTQCPTCTRSNSPAARFCAGCGRSINASRKGRSFAAAPNESVASFALVSTVMPYASAQHNRTYRWAFLLGIAIPILALVFGQPSFALVTAAFVVPVAFIVYLYDVHMWEDQPIPVVLGTIALSALLAVGAALVWRSWAIGQPGLIMPRGVGGFDLVGFLIPCIVAPVIAVILMLIGPVLLARRPAFDDLMDGLTFGVVSGVTFAAVETLVLNWSVIGAGITSTESLAFWIPVIVNAALLKPIVFGCAIGLAAAEFSGLGAGYDGFTGRFFQRLGEAMLLLIAFETGLFFTAQLSNPTGLILGMAWALVIAGAAILRLRTALQRGLLEGALEAAARAADDRWGAGPDEFCAECEMPLLSGALFCVACGASVRARTKDLRLAHHGSDRPEVTR